MISISLKTIDKRNPEQLIQKNERRFCTLYKAELLKIIEQLAGHFVSVAFEFQVRISVQT